MNKGRNFKCNPVVHGFCLTTRQQDISAPVGPSSAISTKQIVIGAKLSQRTLYHGILSPLVLSIVSVTLPGTKELLLLQDPKPQPCASSPTWPPYNGMNSVVGLPQHGHMWGGGSGVGVGCINHKSMHSHVHMSTAYKWLTIRHRSLSSQVRHSSHCFLSIVYYSPLLDVSHLVKCRAPLLGHAMEQCEEHGEG